MSVPPSDKDHATDQIVAVLSMEYQTLREEVLGRLSSRFQFLTIGIAAAAFAASAVGMAPPRQLNAAWQQILASFVVVLIAALFVAGVVTYYRAGVMISVLSERIAKIEVRINSLMGNAYDANDVLVWESERRAQPLPWRTRRISQRKRRKAL